MRIYCFNNDKMRRPDRRCAGMTLVEVMVASSIMLIVIFAMLSANYIGLRENQLMSSKSGANNTSRNVANYLYQDIRMAKGYLIGSPTSTHTLIPITNGIQQGLALQLFPILISTNESIDTTKYILYYFDLSDTTNNNGKLWRYVSTNQTTLVMASNLINTLYFTGEDFTGATQTVRTYKGIIHTTLQFSEFQYPKTKVGSNYLFNYYRIDCRATPHLPDGP